MALAVTRTTVSMKVRDITGTDRSVPLEANPAHPDMADVGTMVGAAGLTNLGAVAAKYAGVSGHVPVGFRITVNIDDDAAPALGAGDPTDDAAISCALATPGKRHTVHIGGPLDAILVGDGAPGANALTVDGTDTALLEWLALFAESVVNSDTDPTGVFLLSDGESLSDTPDPRGRKLGK